MTDIEVGNLRTEISIDDNDVNRTLAELTREVKVAQSEFKKASVEVEGFGKGTDGLKAKSDALTKTISAQQALVNKLRAEHEKAAREKGDDAKQTQNLEVKLNKASTELAKLQNELRTTTTELEKQTTTWQKIGEAVDGFADKTEKVGRRMASVGSEMTMAVTAPLAAVGGLAAKASIDFESAFAGVRKTVDATEEEFASLSEGIREMSKDIPAAATDIASVAEAAGQLGIATPNIMGFTRTMIDLGEATNLSSEQAATSLARLANITQMPQSEFDRLGSTIVALGNNLATTESEIVEMGLRLAGAGKTIGMTEAQMLAFAGSLSSVGIEAEAGGSAFSKLMIGIASEVATGGQKLEQFAGVAGMSAAQFQQAFQQDASGAIITFVEGLGQIQQAGGNVFGVLEDLGITEVRMRDALLRASNAGDLFRESLELGAKAWEENIALADEAEQRYNTTESQLKMLKNELADTAITLGDSLVPAMMAALDAAKPILDAVADMANRFAELDEGTQQTIIRVAAITAAVGPLLIVLGKLVFSIGAITAGVKTLTGALNTLIRNPIALALTALVGVVAAVATSMSNAKRATQELAEAQEELQRIQEQGIDRSEIEATEEKIQSLQELKDTYTELIEVASQQGAAMNGNNVLALDSAAKELNISLKDLAKQADDFGVELEFIDETGTLATVSLNKLEEATNILTTAVAKARRETTAELNDKAQQIAMRQQEVTSVEALIKKYREAKEGSDEWHTAQSELARLFPQYTSEIGVNTEAIEGLLIVKQQEIDAEWLLIQAKAQDIIMEKNRELAVRESAIAAVDAGAKWIFGMENAGNATKLAREEVEKLKGEIVSLEALANAEAPKLDLSGRGGFGGSSGTGTGSNGSENNRNIALDEAYRLLEHKKRLDQLTLEEELRTLEQIGSAHVKSADERRAIEEKIYAVKKEIRNREVSEEYRMLEHKKRMGQLTIEQEIETLEMIKRNYAKSADELMDIEERLFNARQRKAEQYKDRQEDLLNDAVQKYKNSLEDRLIREELSAEEEFKLREGAYDNILQLYKDHLKDVLEDHQYSATEKADIQRRITENIRQQLNERSQLQKSYYDGIRQQEIESINKLSEGLQSALRQKYQDEKDKMEQFFKDALDANEDERKARIAAIQDVYKEKERLAKKDADEEIARINTVYNERIQAINDELAALEAGEKQRTRAELDAEDELRLERLRAKMEYEHDEYNKTQLQKEINKVLAEQEERHRKEQLDDHKEALKEEQKSLQDKLKEEVQAIKTRLEEEKELRDQKREQEIKDINAMYDFFKSDLNRKLQDQKKQYEDMLTAKALQAQAEIMIVENQQEEIIKLLESYSDAYQITGQTLGEKLYEGFKEQADKIQTIIANVNAQIDAMRSAAMSAMAQASTAASGASAASVTHNNRSMVVNNTFQAPVTSPSTISRATQQMGQRLLGL